MLHQNKKRTEKARSKKYLFLHRSCKLTSRSRSGECFPSLLRFAAKASEASIFFFRKTVWACSSVGRALRSQRRGHGFESHQVHQKNCAASVACRAPHRDGALGLLRHVGEIRRRSSVGQSVRFTSVRSRVRAPSSPPKPLRRSATERFSFSASHFSLFTKKRLGALRSKKRTTTTFRKERCAMLSGKKEPRHLRTRKNMTLQDKKLTTKRKTTTSKPPKAPLLGVLFA